MNRFAQHAAMPGTTRHTTGQTTVCVVDACPRDYERLAAEGAANGVRFQFASTGGDALKLGRMSAHTIWLVNIQLPDGSGCEVAAAIRARNPHSVVYLVADRYDAAEELKARLVGGAMYVCKPVDPDWLSVASVPIHRLGRCA